MKAPTSEYAAFQIGFNSPALWSLDARLGERSHIGQVGGLVTADDLASRNARQFFLGRRSAAHDIKRNSRIQEAYAQLILVSATPGPRAGTFHQTGAASVGVSPHQGFDVAA